MSNIMRLGGGTDLDSLDADERRQVIDNLIVGGDGWVTITSRNNTTFTATRRSLVVGMSWGHGTSGSGASTSTSGTQLTQVSGGHQNNDGAGTSSTSLIVAVLEPGQTCTFYGIAADTGRFAYGSIAAYKPID